MTDQEKEMLQKALERAQEVQADLEGMIERQKEEVAKIQALLKGK